MKFLVTCLSLLVFTISLNAQGNWKDVRDVESLCKTYPDVVKKMLDSFNLDYPGMEKIKAASSRGDLVGACNYLLDYYKDKTGLVPPPAKSGKTEALADTILTDVFVIQNVRGQLPYLANGHRDWHYKGPKDDEEWAWLSNRHSQLSRVYSAYRSTGNPKYAEYVDLFLRDFIIASMPYPGEKGNGSIWRGLEVAARANCWTSIFYSSLGDELISPAAKLFILSSLPNHAHYSRNFHEQGNWLTMELKSLANVATKFPEYKGSDEWFAYSVSTMQESMKKQIYPDGVQTELTSHYHAVARYSFEAFKDICGAANKEMPAFYTQTLEKMYGYTASIMRPDGAGVLNNDGDRDDIRQAVLNGAKKYGNKEWEYIATNGKTGTRPAQESYFFPWAGQLISRSGFGYNDQWSFFDIGPWGSGHQHNDKLHISVSAYGRDFLVDGGRFAYTGAVRDKFGKYARGSESHNVLLIDGKGQLPGPKLVTAPLSTDSYKIDKDFDFACGSFDSYIDQTGSVEHNRSLFYVRGEFWVIVDRLITDRPRTIDALWHWHPDCNVVADKLTVKTNNDKGNLSVIPAGKQKLKLKLVKGQESPGIQGWYSPEYNVYFPNTTGIYSAEINGNATFVWVLFPSEKGTPKVKTKIISEDENSVKLEVKTNTGCFQLDIPFFDSKGASLIKK